MEKFITTSGNNGVELVVTLWCSTWQICRTVYF